MIPGVVEPPGASDRFTAVDDDRDRRLGDGRRLGEVLEILDRRGPEPALLVEGADLADGHGAIEPDRPEPVRARPVARTGDRAGHEPLVPGLGGTLLGFVHCLMASYFLKS